MASRILVLGASGGCGRHVVAEAARRGHAVTAVVRPEARYAAPAGVHVACDDVLRPGALAAIAGGHDAVVSCLGIRRRHPRNPWSRLVSPPDFTSASAAVLVAAMRATGVGRVVAISAAGVADSAPRMNPIMRWLVRASRIGDQYRDLAAMEAIYAASDLDWCAVRPVTLTAGRARPTRDVDRFGTFAFIARAAVARWMLDWIDHGAASRTPMIAHA